MKNVKAITLVLGLLVVSFSGFAQERADELKARFEKIKTELELTEEQEAEVKALFKERRAKLNAEDKSELSATDKREQRIARMKERRAANQEFKAELSKILDEEQMAKFENMLEERKHEMKKHKHHAPKERMHKHENGVEHSH